jgi:hypothetical protein
MITFFASGKPINNPQDISIKEEIVYLQKRNNNEEVSDNIS